MRRLSLVLVSWHGSLEFAEHSDRFNDGVLVSLRYVPLLVALTDHFLDLPRVKSFLIKVLENWYDLLFKLVNFALRHFRLVNRLSYSNWTAYAQFLDWNESRFNCRASARAFSSIVARRMQIRASCPNESPHEVSMIRN